MARRQLPARTPQRQLIFPQEIRPGERSWSKPRPVWDWCSFCCWSGASSPAVHCLDSAARPNTPSIRLRFQPCQDADGMSIAENRREPHNFADRGLPGRSGWKPKRHAKEPKPPPRSMATAAARMAARRDFQRTLALNQPRYRAVPPISGRTMNSGVSYGCSARTSFSSAGTASVVLSRSSLNNCSARSNSPAPM